MLPANMIALSHNLKLADLTGYLADTPLKQGRTRNPLFAEVLKPSDANHVLVVDDSIDSGRSLESAQSLIAGIGRQQKITYCIVYSTIRSTHKPDVFLEVVPQPRIFEWNVMHRPFLTQCCLDIDGVLCLDPTNDENDDGSSYINFLLNVPPLVVPSCRVGHLVTSRLEKYRSETEQWLEKHGFVYGQLHMLDLPDAQIRRRLDCHASFKAEVFRSLKDTKLFIESEPNQSARIANIAGKPVLCFRKQKMYYPGFSYALVENKAHTFARRVLNKLARIVKRVSNL
jgi:uncharacterized HAD superfamily protein